MPLFCTAAVISLHNDTHSFVRVCSLHSPVSHLAGLGAAVEHTFAIPVRQAWPKKQLKYLNTWLWLKSALSVRGMFSHLLTRTKSKLALSWYFSKCFYKYQSSARNTSHALFFTRGVELSDPKARAFSVRDNSAILPSRASSASFSPCFVTREENCCIIALWCPLNTDKKPVWAVNPCPHPLPPFQVEKLRENLYQDWTLQVLLSILSSVQQDPLALQWSPSRTYRKSSIRRKGEIPLSLHWQGTVGLQGDIFLLPIKKQCPSPR